MGQYATETKVTPNQSRQEIERTLERYGATGFMYAWKGDRALIMFEANGRRVRFILPLPDPNGRDFQQTPTGRTRSVASAREAYDQAVKQRWRALALVIKAKLEAWECGIGSFDELFLSNLVLPDDSTVADFMVPQVERVYKTGEMPALLPGGHDPKVIMLPAPKEWVE